MNIKNDASTANRLKQVNLLLDFMADNGLQAKIKAERHFLPVRQFCVQRFFNAGNAIMVGVDKSQNMRRCLAARVNPRHAPGKIHTRDAKL